MGILTSFITILYLYFITICSSIVQEQPQQELTTKIFGKIRLPHTNSITHLPKLEVTRVTLNDGEYSTYTNTDGVFSFYSVTPGVHVLDVHNHIYSFSQIKIQLTEDDMENPHCIEYIYPGSHKNVVSHPLELIAHAKYQYSTKNPGPNFWMLFQNPMALLMLVTIGFMFIMPKIMDTMDDEQKIQMKKQLDIQNNMAKDPTKLLQQFLGRENDCDIRKSKKNNRHYTRKNQILSLKQE